MGLISEFILVKQQVLFNLFLQFAVLFHLFVQLIRHFDQVSLQGWTEAAAERFMSLCRVVSLQALEDKNRRNAQENLCVARINLFLELRVLLAYMLDAKAEADKLLSLLLIKKLIATLNP